MLHSIKRLMFGYLSFGLTTLVVKAESHRFTEVKIDWNRVVIESKATPTLQVVVNPALRRSSPIHARAFEELRNLGADHVRFVPWLPYPKLAVAALQPPEPEKTYWE